MHTRPASPADAPLLLALGNAVDRAWWGQDETDLDEVEQRLRLADDLTARTRVVETSDGLVGYAVAFGHHDIDILVAPELPPRIRHRVEDELLGWLVDAGGDRVEAPAQATDQLAAFARHGFLPAWSSFELERVPDSPPASAALPLGVELRPFDRLEHAQTVHEMLYRFWTVVPSHPHRTFEEWQELFLAHGSFDPGLQVVAWRDDVPVGVAICRVYTGAAGWISQLGVVPEERGTGLGRALLAEAARRLGAVPDIDTVGLAVAAQNTRALALYRSVGFEVTREWVACERSSRAAATQRDV
jgi:ribosomal protein S18 acetylase RimI-like enzyme